MRATPLALLAVATLVFPAAFAGHCEEPFLGRESDLTLRDPQNGKVRYYVEVDQCDEVECHDLWIYEETNGLPNLQRYDKGAQGLQDDTCHGMIRPDTRLF